MDRARYIPQHTVAEYQQWPGEWELWAGVPVAMSPSPKRVHQRLSRELCLLLHNKLKAEGCQDCEVLYEIDWIVSENTVYRPDVVVTCEPDGNDYIRKPPVFIAEILSDSTRRKDTIFKHRAYQDLGVKYFLTVEPEDSTVAFFSLEDGTYRPMESERVELSDGCVLSVKFADIFSSV